MMKPLCFCLLIAVNFHASQGFLFGGNSNWDDLKVTWGMNPFDSNNYASLPRSETDAKKKGWTKESDCSSTNGIHYVLKGDRSVILIFKADGNIAGIAAAIPKNLPFNFPSEKIRDFFDEEENSWRITAYFTDPESVCSRAKLSTGDRLVFKSKTLEKSIALLESEVDQGFWTQGKCFYTMGSEALI